MSRAYRKETSTETLTAKDREGNIKGQGTVTLYSEDKAGHAACLKVEGYKDIMWLRNRQAASQVLNENRRTLDEGKALAKSVNKTRGKLDDSKKAAMDKELKAVQARFEAEQAATDFQADLIASGKTEAEVSKAMEKYHSDIAAEIEETEKEAAEEKETSQVV